MVGLVLDKWPMVTRDRNTECSKSGEGLSIYEMICFKHTKSWYGRLERFISFRHPMLAKI